MLIPPQACLPQPHHYLTKKETKMATSYHYFTGKSKWAKVHKPDERYGNFSIDVNLDAKQLETFTKLGVRTKPKTDEDGNVWVTFRRNPNSLTWKEGNRVPAGKPAVTDANGAPMEGTIGNGSTVTVKLQVYTYDNSFGKGVGSRLEAVRVDELVEYKREEATINHPFQ